MGRVRGELLRWHHNGNNGHPKEDLFRKAARSVGFHREGTGVAHDVTLTYIHVHRSPSSRSENLMSLDISVAATWETPLQVLMCPIFHREGDDVVEGNVFVFNDCSLAKSH